MTEPVDRMSVITIPIKLRIVMYTDWRAEPAVSRGESDCDALPRDADGLPYIPGNVLLQLWRDACELVARALDRGKPNGPWGRLVGLLFGTDRSQKTMTPWSKCGRPQPAFLRVHAARYPQPLRAVVAGEQAALRAMTVVDSENTAAVLSGLCNGHTDDGRLQAIEKARAGSELWADAVLQIPASLREQAVALLVAATRLMTRVGAQRNRASGVCRVRALDPSRAETELMSIDRVCEVLTAGPPRFELSREEEFAVRLHATCSRQPDGYVCVPLAVELHSPITIGYQAAGNVVRSLDYVPGYYLLPHVTRILRSFGLRMDELFPEIAAGRIRVLNATLQVGGGRGMPVPSCIEAYEHGPGFAEPAEGLRNSFVDRTGGETVRPMRAVTGYLYYGPRARVSFARAPMVIQTSNPGSGGAGGAADRDGERSVFEAIAPADGDSPTVLRSAVILPAYVVERLAAKEDDWWKRFDAPLALGRTPDRAHGTAYVTALPPTPQAISAPRSSDGLLAVWLLSDVLLRGTSLRFEPTIGTLKQALEEALDVDLTLICSRVRTGRLETWHSGWGLPRPSMIAIRAGSCALFKIGKGCLSAERLAQLTIRGLGERTAEGFGEVCFNHPVVTTSPRRWRAAARTRRCQKTRPTRLRATDPGYKFACLIEREAWKESVDRAAAVIAADRAARAELLEWAVEADGQAPLSRIMALRTVVQRVRSFDDAARVRGWLRRLSENNRSDDRACGRSQAALRRCLELFRKRSMIWTILERAVSDWPVLTIGAKQRLREDLWAYAVNALVEACARAYRMEAEELARGGRPSSRRTDTSAVDSH